ADSADGLWGGWEKDRRLEIMKDSRIGAYGVLALVLSLGLRWVALIAVVEAGALWPVVIGTAALSRAAMVGLMYALPNARTGGLSRSVGRPPRAAALLASGIGGGVWLVLSASGGPLFAALIAAVVCGLIAQAKIGGQTGDILGATQQITEIAVLLAVVAQLSAA
ncbi:MAG: adenosylcobinamide-GDP ribazoletransferase, partial [Octadecabacter sp.]|nr:adenosylcobinamide-GDP ribazoletransferase [Octadecabacter sp.]